MRQGFPEVVLGTGKTPAQIAAIAERIVARGQSLLVTRATVEAQAAVLAKVPGGELQRGGAHASPCASRTSSRDGARC